MRRTYARLAAPLLALALLAGCKTELYSDLTEREANQIVAALSEIGIPADKRASNDGMSVRVVDSRFAEAVQLLTARGLPAQDYQSFGDVFKKEGIVSSPIEERARYIYALSQELSRTIAEIDGVLSARIHVVLPETDMLGRDFKPSSASIFIRYAPDAAVSEFTAQIKLLVANSIEGLIYDNVTVVTVPAVPREVAQSEGPVLENVAGVWVHPNSVDRLYGIVAGMGAVVLLALGLAGTVLMARRRDQLGLDEGFDST